MAGVRRPFIEIQILAVRVLVVLDFLNKYDSGTN